MAKVIFSYEIETSASPAEIGAAKSQLAHYARDVAVSLKGKLTGAEVRLAHEPTKFTSTDETPTRGASS